MEEITSSPAEINSIAYLNKKRKLQDELLLEMPSPKHVCWSQNVESHSSSDSSREPKQMESENFAGGGESEPESAKESNSFHCNADSIMCTDDEANTNEPSTSSVCWAGASSEVGPYSLESKSLAKSSFSEQESSSTSDQQFDRPDYQFGSYADCIEQCPNKELENLLCSNGVASGNYVLSSGRWSINQEGQQEGKKLTIDKEFEQYFSMLML